MLFVPLHLCVVFVPGDKPLLSYGLTHEALYIIVPRGTNKLYVPRGQTKGDTLTHSLTNEALYIYR